MSKSTRSKLITYAICLIAFAVAYTMIETGHATRQFQKMMLPICVYVILAVSLNITVGFLGELTLGHAGFMSVGAYTGCLFSIYTKEILPVGIRFPLAMIMGGLVAALFGILIGVPALRLRGDYLAIVTLAFGEIIRSVIINLDFTGGASGLKGTPRDSTFLVAFVVVMITVVVATNLMDSKHGRAITAMRDNRIAAEATGINLTYFKLMSFVVAAFFAGVAGVLYGHNMASLTAGKFDYNFSIEILVIVVLGGLGSIRGSIIAAVIIYVLPEMLREFSDYRMLIYSIVLIVMMLLNSSSRFDAIKAKLNYRSLVKAVTGRKGGAQA